MDKILSVAAHCNYDKQHTYEIGQFVMTFSDYLKHPTSGGYGREACIDLQTFDDMLLVSMNYSYTNGMEEVCTTRDYNITCYIDFTPNSQMHYAISKRIDYIFNSNYIFDSDCIFDSNTALQCSSVSTKAIDNLFNDMTIATDFLSFNERGYDVSFDIKNDNSHILYNGKHCTITEYLKKYLNILPQSLNMDRNTIIPEHMRSCAKEKMIERKREEERMNALWRNQEYLDYLDSKFGFSSRCGKK